MAVGELNQIIPRNVDYAPAIKIERKEKNFFQKIIAWVGSLFCTVGANWHTSQEMRALFQKRVQIHQASGDQTAVKAVTLMQRFLVEPKKGGLEPSCFEQKGIQMRNLMDPLLLDLALHTDPAEYIEREKTRIATHCTQLVQQIAQDLKRRTPGMAARCDGIVERGEQLTPDELSAWIEELRQVRGIARSKPFAVLEEIAALRHLDVRVLDAELVTHYLGSLQIHEKYALKYLPDNALSRSEIRALEILSEKLAHGGRVEGMDSKRLRRFLDEAQGNLELNRRLIRYADSQHLTISKQALELVLDLTYKIGQAGEYFTVMAKVDTLRARLLANQGTTPEERLSLKEVKKVESLARLHEKFDQLAAIGAPSQHPLVETAARSDQFVRNVLERAEHDQPHKSGSAIFYDYPNADVYLNWPGGAFRKFLYRLLPWPLIHTGLAVRHQDQNWISHMYHGHHAMHRRSIGDYAFKTFEFDFTKAISPVGSRILAERLGRDWHLEVERIYGEITHNIHTNKELLAQFHNPPIKQVLAAMSIGFGLFDNHAMEHRPLNKQQICSSFVLNTALAAIVRLEERLLELCNARQDLPPLPADFRFTNLPIERTRLLDFVLPHQLAKKVLPISKEVPKPQVIHQILNFHDFSMP